MIAAAIFIVAAVSAILLGDLPWYWVVYGLLVTLAAGLDLVGHDWWPALVDVGLIAFACYAYRHAVRQRQARQVVDEALQRAVERWLRGLHGGDQP